MLNEKIKKELLEKVNDIEVDVSQLDSYSWDNDPYGLEPSLAWGSGQSVWDEDEEYKAKLKMLAELVKDGSLCEYATLADDEDEDGQMSLEAYLWLMSLTGE